MAQQPLFTFPPGGFLQNNMANSFPLNYPNNQMGARRPIVPIISKRSVDAYGKFHPFITPPQSIGSNQRSNNIPRSKRGIFGGNDDTTLSTISSKIIPKAKGNSFSRPESTFFSTLFPQHSSLKLM